MASEQEAKFKRNLDKVKSSSTPREPKKGILNHSKGAMDTLKGKSIDTMSYFYLAMIAVFALAIDLLPVVTGDISSVIDWIFDFTFFIALTITMMITTGDILGSVAGKKALVNATQTIVEFIPLIDVMPFHLLAVLIIYLDLKYNILSKVTKLKTN